MTLHKVACKNTGHVNKSIKVGLYAGSFSSLGLHYKPARISLEQRLVGRFNYKTRGYVTVIKAGT